MPPVADDDADGDDDGGDADGDATDADTTPFHAGALETFSPKTLQRLTDASRLNGNRNGTDDPGGAWGGWMLVSANFRRLVLGCIEAKFCQ